MTNSTRVTPAQEALTCAMLTAFFTCLAIIYALIIMLNITSIAGYLTLAVATFITTGYLTPNLTATWIDRPLNEILDDTTTVESNFDETDTLD